jgi:hypothetical protein
MKSGESPGIYLRNVSSLFSVKVKSSLHRLWRSLRLREVEAPTFANIRLIDCVKDRLCGLVFRVPGYRSRGPGFDSRSYQIF